MDYIPALAPFTTQNEWITVNDDDQQFERTGVYVVAATPEPSALWLILFGLTLVATKRIANMNLGGNRTEPPGGRGQLLTRVRPVAESSLSNRHITHKSF